MSSTLKLSHRLIMHLRGHLINKLKHDAVLQSKEYLYGNQVKLFVYTGPLNNDDIATPKLTNTLSKIKFCIIMIHCYLKKTKSQRLLALHVSDVNIYQKVG